MKWAVWILLLLIAYGSGFISAWLMKRNDREKKYFQQLSEKVSLYYQILNMWLEMKQKGKSAVTFLQKKEIKRIAIYGMKELGERLYEEVKGTEIKVACIIDKNPDQIKGDFVVISPEDTIPEVDAIIITADYYYWEIKKQLQEKVSCPIYSLNGVLGNSFGRNL